MKTKMQISLLYFFMLLVLGVSNLYAATQDVDLKKGWNQITVPLDHIKIDLLLASENIDVIWAYQNLRYNLASNNKAYLKKADDSFDIGTIMKLSYGESIYVQALEDTTMTFVGQTNYNKPVRADQLTSQWIQMSRSDFPQTDWPVISKIAGDKEIIASKIVMIDGRPSLKVFSNVDEEVAKIDGDFFEDFEVGEHESFWIKDVTNVSNINKFDFSISNKTPTSGLKGGSPISFDFDVESTNENKNYLAIKIVAFKDGEVSNKQHVLFDDYIKLRDGIQSVDVVLPMLLNQDFGSYKIYAIKDLAAQYDDMDIDYYNLTDMQEANNEVNYKKVLDRSDYINVNLSENSEDVEYRLKIESREYANSVLYYDPKKELNAMAQNARKSISEFSYQDIGKHTEFQLKLETFGNLSQPVEKTKIKAYLKLEDGYEEIIVLSNKAGNEDSYSLDNMKISFPDEKQGESLTLSLMMYGTEALKENYDNTKNTQLYADVLAELSKSKEVVADDGESSSVVYDNKICLDTECTKWFFKKDFEIGIAVKDVSADENAEFDTDKDIKNTTTVTLYSETFSKSIVKNYESKDTIISLSNQLLKDDTFDNNTATKRAIGTLGSGAGTQILKTHLTKLKDDLLQDNANTNLIFDPLVTFENNTIDRLIYGKNIKTGAIDKTKTNDSELKAQWSNYIANVGDESKLCDRKNYNNLTVPYTIKQSNQSGGDDIDVLTATDDLCLYNVKYSYLNTLTPDKIELIAGFFKEFAVLKNTRNEDEILADFWNPLFKLDNATLHIPEFVGTTIPLLKKRMGGGVTFSSKMAIDSELNELRTNAYTDVDVAMIKEFKLLDLDFETVISGSDKDASRFDFFLYSINPSDDGDTFALKKIFAFHQKITTTYQLEKMKDVTFEKGKDIDIPLYAGINLHIGMEMGLYSFFEVGTHLDVAEHLMVYAIPGARIYGTLEGGLSFGISKLKVGVGIRLDDFTVIRANVPIVAVLDKLRLDKEGFSSVFRIYSNLIMRMAEINVGAYAKVDPIKVDLYINLYSYKGFDPLKTMGFTVGTGKQTDITECQKAYHGWELFCLRKELKIQFEFSGLTQEECKILDNEYLRKKVYENDTSYYYSTAEYRKVRGCQNDSYTFKNIKLKDWKLSESQIKEINNASFWKKDSRGIIAVLLEKDEDEDDHSTPWADAWKSSEEAEEDGESADPIHDKWKEITKYKW